MTKPEPSGANPPGKDQDADGRQRLHRDPANVDGLQPGKFGDHEPSEKADRRSAEGRKPYTTEAETYGEGPVRGPDAPVAREEATRPPRR